MTPENQRIAIARACGWTDVIRKNISHFGLYGKKPKPPRTGLGGGADTEQLVSNVPDYCNSLDAMHEAEKVLKTVSEQNRYQADIAELCYNDYDRRDNQVVFNQITASAPQRAEAFLKTLGLWTED